MTGALVTSYVSTAVGNDFQSLSTIQGTFLLLVLTFLYHHALSLLMYILLDVHNIVIIFNV